MRIEECLEKSRFESQGSIVLKGQTIPYRTVSEDNFFVDEEGKPQNITVIHGLCEFADKEAIRLVKEGPKWTSGKLPARVTVRF